MKETVDILTGRLGGKISSTKGLKSPSVGIDVASATGTNVAKTSELTQLIRRVADIERALNALITRLNAGTPSPAASNVAPITVNQAFNALLLSHQADHGEYGAWYFGEIPVGGSLLR